MNKNDLELIVEIIGQRLDSLAESFLRDIAQDYDKQEKEPYYSDTLIRIIIMSSQEFEALLRKFIIANGIQANFDIWNKSAGILLGEIKKTGKFNNKQIELLNRIIEQRNWVVHEIYEAEREYNNAHVNGFGILDNRDWMRYYRIRLAIAKSVIYEAVDLFNGATSLLSDISLNDIK